MMPLSARKGSWLVSEEVERLLLTARRQPKIIDLIVCLLLTAFFCGISLGSRRSLQPV